MSEDGFTCTANLAQARVAILGLGLMGGSLALALRGRCASLVGCDPDPQVIQLADQRNMVDRASTELKNILPDSDLIILAAPVLAILELLKDLARFHPTPAVVIDLGSTKNQIVKAMTDLPEQFDPLGGHPMCGKERGTVINADPDLFREATFALTPLPRTSDRAKRLALEVVEVIGSQPLWMDAVEHDRWVAASSHLPYLLANALTLAVPGEAANLTGPGFASTTRLASSYTPMMLDVLRTNRLNIIDALQEFRSSLDEFRRCLEDEDYEEMQSLLKNSAQKHIQLTRQGAR